MRFYAAQQGHIVNVIPPVDWTGGKTGTRFSMKMWSHASILVQIGVSAAAFTKLFVKEATLQSGGSVQDLATGKARYYEETTAAGDTLSAAIDYPNGGITPTANDNTMYCIELDAADLSDGFPYVEVSATNGANAVLASCVAILSGGRFANDLGATAIV